MRDDHIDLCGQVDFTRTEAMPLLERESQFCFLHCLVQGKKENLQKTIILYIL